MDQEDRLEALDQHLHQTTDGLEQMRESVAHLDERLGQLTEAHESIELQLALLSKEAEQYDSWLRLSDPDSEFSHRQKSDNGKLYAIEQQVLALAESVEQLGGRQPNQASTQDAPRHWANIESDLTEDRRRIDLLLARIDALEAEVADAQLAVADVDSRLQDGPGGPTDLTPDLQGVVASVPDSEEESDTTPAVIHALDTVVGHHPHKVHHDIQALKVAGGMLLDRLVALEQKTRSLKSSVSSMGVEQARRDGEGLQLKRQLRRRSLVSGLALLLASLSVFLVLQTMPPRVADRAVPVAEPLVAPIETPSADADIRAAVADVREEMMLFDTSLASLAESVDQLALAPQTQRDSMIDDVQQSVAQLASDDTKLREDLEEIRREQARIEDSIARIIAPRSNMPVVAVAQDLPVSDDAVNMPKATPVEPEQGEPEPIRPEQVEPAPIRPERVEPAPVEPKQIAPEQVKQAAVDPERSGRVFSVIPVSNGVEADWEAARSGGRYTLQLMGVSKSALIDAALQQYGLEGPNAVHHGTRQGRDWFALLHGIYETSADAQAAIAGLPAALSAKKPWIRQVPSAGRLEAR